jgi:cellobiose-specific phosphotransferase system component IIA
LFNLLQSHWLKAIKSEIIVVHNVLYIREFEKASRKVREALDNARYNKYEQATMKISEAISQVANCDQWALQILKDNGLM